MACSLLDRYRCFGGVCCRHLQGERINRARKRVILMQRIRTRDIKVAEFSHKYFSPMCIYFEVYKGINRKCGAFEFFSCSVTTLLDFSHIYAACFYYLQ